MAARFGCKVYTHFDRGARLIYASIVKTTCFLSNVSWLMVTDLIWVVRCILYILVVSILPSSKNNNQKPICPRQLERTPNNLTSAKLNTTQRQGPFSIPSFPFHSLLPSFLPSLFLNFNIENRK
mmetsp:Transcript_38172/g.59284  ORF Transcript_38172/g.59284 Transcript_38172/m.59284 type:complete len:124 (+) Transcript_38172:118-489(+)